MFGGVPLRSMIGYLAAFSASETFVGSVECPWLLDLQPGQHVNISVYGGFSPSHNQLGSFCLIALVIQDDNKTTLLPGCTPLRYDIIIIGGVQLLPPSLSVSVALTFRCTIK